MSLFYTIVFYLLILEASLIVLLLAPLPYRLRKSLLKFVSKNAAVTQVKQLFTIIFVFVFLLFLDSTSKMYRAQNDHDHPGHESKDMRTDTFQHAKMFYAQRNMYLTGSVLFLALILNRFHSMITELVKGTENIEVLKAQSSKTSAEYMKMLDKEKDHETRITDMTLEVEEANKKSKSADALVKQAKNQETAYMDLADRFNALEKLHSKPGGNRKDD